MPGRLGSTSLMNPSALAGAVMENDQCTFQIIDLGSPRNPASALVPLLLVRKAIPPAKARATFLLTDMQKDRPPTQSSHWRAEKRHLGY